MAVAETTIAPPEPTTSSALEFEVSDITGTSEALVTDVDPSTLAGAVAKSLASRMSLPDVPWALRNDRTSAELADDKPIGEQLRSGQREHLTLTPRTHLG